MAHMAWRCFEDGRIDSHGPMEYSVCGVLLKLHYCVAKSEGMSLPHYVRALGNDN